MEKYTPTTDVPDWFYILGWRSCPSVAPSTSWPFLVGNWLVGADAISVGWCRYTPDCPLSMEFLSRNNSRLSSIRKFLLPILEAAPLLTFKAEGINFAGDVVIYRGDNYSASLLARSPVRGGDQTKHQVARMEISTKDDDGKPLGKSMALVTKWGDHAYSLIAPC